MNHHDPIPVNDPNWIGPLPGEPEPMSEATRTLGKQVCQNLTVMLQESKKLARNSPNAAKRQLNARMQHLAEVLNKRSSAA